VSWVMPRLAREGGEVCFDCVVKLVLYICIALVVLHVDARYSEFVTLARREGQYEASFVRSVYLHRCWRTVTSRLAVPDNHHPPRWVVVMVPGSEVNVFKLFHMLVSVVERGDVLTRQFGLAENREVTVPTLDSIKDTVEFGPIVEERASLPPHVRLHYYYFAIRCRIPHLLVLVCVMPVLELRGNHLDGCPIEDLLCPMCGCA
jgi:hypothetical protein